MGCNCPSNIVAIGPVTQLGVDPSQSPINCLWGTPFKDANGVWTCPSAPNDPGTKNPTPPPLLGLRQWQAWQAAHPGTTYGSNIPPKTTVPAVPDATAADDTILGIPTNYLVWGGVAIAALWALSSMQPAAATPAVVGGRTR